jgi:hypothetical protein
MDAGALATRLGFDALPPGGAFVAYKLHHRRRAPGERLHRDARRAGSREAWVEHLDGPLSVVVGVK